MGKGFEVLNGRGGKWRLLTERESEKENGNGGSGR